MKSRYPIEAFAFAMIVFTQDMRISLVTGILIMFITTLGLVLDEFIGSKLPIWSRNSCTIILMVSFAFSIFRVVLIGILGYELDSVAYIYHVFLGILMAKHIIDAQGKVSYNRLLLEGAGAYAAMLIISIFREFMAYGSIYGYEIAQFNLMSNGFSSVATGFVLAAIGIAILNRIYGYKNIQTRSILVILPVVLVEQPFVIANISSSASTLITIIFVLLMLYSVKRHLIFSKLRKEIKHLPASLMSTGMIYIILSMF